MEIQACMNRYQGYGEVKLLEWVSRRASWTNNMQVMYLTCRSYKKVYLAGEKKKKNKVRCANRGLCALKKKKKVCWSQQLPYSLHCIGNTNTNTTLKHSSTYLRMGEVEEGEERRKRGDGRRLRSLLSEYYGTGQAEDPAASDPTNIDRCVLYSLCSTCFLPSYYS